MRADSRLAGFFTPVLAGTFGGVLMGLSEAAHGTHQGWLDGFLAHAWPLSVRTGIAGALMGLVAAVVIGATLAAVPRLRTSFVLRLLLLGLLIAAGLVIYKFIRPGYLAGTGRNLLWTAYGGVLALPFAPRREPRGRGLPLLWACACLLVAPILSLLNPVLLRGSLGTIALFQMGLGISVSALALYHARRSVSPTLIRWSTALLLLVLLLGARLAPGPVPASATLFFTSVRFEFLELRLREIWILEDRNWRPPSTHVEEHEVFPTRQVHDEARARWKERRGGAEPLSILWITIDALRPELLTEQPSLIPEVVRISKESIVFRNAYAQWPATVMSLESAFCGRYPNDTAYARGEPLGRYVSIQEVMARHGRRSFSVVGMGAHLFKRRDFSRLRHGFQRFRPSKGATDAVETAAEAIDLIRRKGPFFGWVHFFDPHEPYVPRDDVPADASVRRRWEGELTYADRSLATLLRALEDSGRLDTTVVVVHADHGEAFGDHGKWFHGTSFFDAQIHVPLLVRAPGIEPGEVDAPVGCVDATATMFDLAGIPVPDTHQGSSLLHMMLDTAAAEGHAAFAESPFNWTWFRTRAVMRGPWKLLTDLRTGYTALINREEDPGEVKNLVERHPDEVSRLLGTLEALDRRRKRQ